ncbi:MAG: ABC transporter substrate-binding protein [Lawsonibacter sp.]|nr:ABC transporter substrate-binding protein [Lawsonibacter sp.]
MKKALALLLAAAMSLSLAACGNNNAGGGANSSAGGGAKSEIELNTGGVATAMETAAESVTVAVDDDSFTIGPWGSDSAVRDWTETIMWTHLAYRPFIGAAFEAGELELVAAKSVNKVDATTYDVEIYDNIVDSKGNAIKASDVVFSYDKLAELGYVTEISTYYDSAEATGDYTLTIKLKSDTEGAIEEILCGCSIASQSWYEGASQDEIEGNPATTGPYTVSNMEIGASLTMTAKDNYWKTGELTTVELQNVKNIKLKCITEASMRSVALENGEVDMAEIAASDLSRFDSNSDYNITRYMNAMSQYLIYNTSENSPMHDVNVRRAVSYATDALTVMMGGGSDACVVSHDVAPNKGPDYVQDWDNQPYFEQDLDKAAECLAAAGYKPGELKLSILTSAQAPQGPYVALQAMLQEAGIELEIMALDRAARMGVQNDPTAWDIAEYSDVVTDFTTHFWSNLFNEDNYELGTQGFTQDPELQRLLKAAMADRSEENMNAFHDYVIENCYMYGLYTEIRSIVTTKGLTDVCMQKENPVLNAMTFTGDYTPAA